MNFLWGAATSSHQIEGNNIHNDWWQWELDGNIEGGVVSGPAADHWNRWKEDLRLAKELGLTSYRFSVEWSRLEPEEGRWNHEAIEWYRELIDECERLDLVPMVTLHHFTLPRWFTERGGFLWESSSGRFAGFLKKVLKEFGAKVPLWCTLNEPNNLVIGQYLGGYMPPAIYDVKGAAVASRNLFRAHVLAYDLIHSTLTKREGKWKDRPLEVGLALNFIDFVPLRPWHPVEVVSTKLFHHYYNLAWVDAVVGKKQHFGVPGILPYAAQVPQAQGRKTADFMGVNYYTRVYVSTKKTAFSSSSLPVGILFSKPGQPASDMGWVIHPAGLCNLIEILKPYGLPLYVTENGIADSSDKMRSTFLKSHLNVIAREIAKGADIRGYYHWSLIDNFEWMKGFWPRFGLYGVDYETFERTLRPSGRLYQEIIAKHADTAPNQSLLAKVKGS